VKACFKLLEVNGDFMTKKTIEKKAPKNPFGDILFLTFFCAALLISISGERFMKWLGNIFGLPPGWPELLQGALGILFMILWAIRGFQLGRMRKATQKEESYETSETTTQNFTRQTYESAQVPNSGKEQTNKA